MKLNSTNSLELPESVSNWSKDNITSIIDRKTRENQYIEYKKILRNEDDESWKLKLEREFAAFANSNGGYVIFGIDEQNGLPKKEGVEFEPDIDKYIKEIIKGTVPRIETESKFIPLSKNGNYGVFAVQVKQSIRKPVTCSDSSHYIRIKSHKVPMSRNQLYSLFVSEEDRQKSLNKLEFQIAKFYRFIKKVKYHELDSHGYIEYGDNKALLESVNIEQIRESIIESRLQEEKKARSIIMEIEDSIQDLIYLKNQGVQNLQENTSSGIGMTKSESKKLLCRLCYYFSRLQDKIELDIDEDVPNELIEYYEARLKEEFERDELRVLASPVSEYKKETIENMKENLRIEEIEFSDIEEESDINIKTANLLRFLKNMSYEGVENDTIVKKDMVSKGDEIGNYEYKIKPFLNVKIKFSGDRELLKYVPEGVEFRELEYDHVYENSIVREFNIEDSREDPLSDSNIADWINRATDFVRNLQKEIDTINKENIDEIKELMRQAEKVNSDLDTVDEEVDSLDNSQREVDPEE